MNDGCGDRDRGGDDLRRRAEHPHFVCRQFNAEC
jgi:hypothetical protein